jgi:PRC-barrel domain protein
VIAMTATEVWVWTIEVLPEAPDSAGGTQGMPDITGYEVSARDGNIGKIEEVVHGDDGRVYLVVDTGFWIFEKKRMIPAGVIDTIDHKNRRINVKMTKDEIKKAPDYDAKHRNDDDVRKETEKAYGPFVGRR